jgi:hypothetical protein
MGGFEYSLIETPERVRALEAALYEFKIWQKATGCSLKRDYTGITDMDIFESPDEALFTRPKYDKTYSISKRLTPNEIEEMKKGKWCCHWFEITWLHRWREAEIDQLITSCKKYGCSWFLVGFLETADKWGKCFEDIMNQFREEFGNELKVVAYGIPENEAGGNLNE